MSLTFWMPIPARHRVNRQSSGFEGGGEKKKLTQSQLGRVQKLSTKVVFVQNFRLGRVCPKLNVFLHLFYTNQENQMELL